MNTTSDLTDTGVASVVATGPRYRRAQASAYLKNKYGICLSQATLARMAVTGGGPRFRKDGRFPLYDEPELDRFAEARLGPLRASTSDTSSDAPAMAA